MIVKILELISALINKIFNKQNQTTTKPDQPEEVSPNPNQEEFEKFQLEMLELHNKKRTDKGISKLVLDKTLCNKAQNWAKTMASKRRMVHGNVATPGFSYAAENIAVGSKTVESTFDMWWHSAGHRNNLLGSNYTHVGFGLAYSGNTPYWCANFGRKI